MIEQISLIAGFIGTAVVLIAYLPQIIHLIHEHCMVGISRIHTGCEFLHLC